MDEIEDPPTRFVRLLSLGLYPLLQALCFRGKVHLNDKAMLSLSIALGVGACRELRCLELKKTDISKKGVKLLAKGLKQGNCTHLTKLVVKDDGPPDIGKLDAITQTLLAGVCPKLQELGIRRGLGRKGMEALVSLLKDGVCSDLRVLSLYTNDLSQKKMNSLGEALRYGRCKGLEKLNIGGNRITPQVLDTFLLAFNEGACPKLSLLGLHQSKTQFGSVGAYGLAEALGGKIFPNLQYLDVGNNFIGLDGMKALAKSFVRGGNNKIRGLYLSMSFMRDEGLTVLIEALVEGGITLKHLDLSGNSITDEGVSYLASKVKQMGTELRMLSLCENCLCSSDAFYRLLDCMKEGSFPKLELLNMSGIELGDECAEAFGEAMEQTQCCLEMNTMVFGYCGMSRDIIEELKRWLISAGRDRVQVLWEASS